MELDLISDGKKDEQSRDFSWNRFWNPGIQWILPRLDLWNGSTDTLGLIERQGQVKGGAAKRASGFMAIVPSAGIQHFTTRKAVCCSRASTSKIL